MHLKWKFLLVWNTPTFMHGICWVEMFLKYFWNSNEILYFLSISSFRNVFCWIQIIYWIIYALEPILEWGMLSHKNSIVKKCQLSRKLKLKIPADRINIDLSTNITIVFYKVGFGLEMLAEMPIVANIQSKPFWYHSKQRKLISVSVRRWYLFCWLISGI